MIILCMYVYGRDQLSVLLLKKSSQNLQTTVFLDMFIDHNNETQNPGVYTEFWCKLMVLRKQTGLA
jgi:hypothetical protein